MLRNRESDIAREVLWRCGMCGNLVSRKEEPNRCLNCRTKEEGLYCRVAETKVIKD